MKSNNNSEGLSEGVLAAMRPMMEVEKMINNSMNGIILNQHSLAEEIRKKLEPFTAATNLARQINSTTLLDKIIPNYDSFLKGVRSSMATNALDELSKKMKENVFFSQGFLNDRLSIPETKFDLFFSEQQELLKKLDFSNHPIIKQTLESQKWVENLSEETQEFTTLDGIYTKLETVFDDIPLDFDEAEIDEEYLEKTIHQSQKLVLSISPEQYNLMYCILLSSCITMVNVYLDNKSIQNFLFLLNNLVTLLSLSDWLSRSSKSKNQTEDYFLLKDTVLRTNSDENSAIKATVNEGTILIIKQRKKSWVLVETFDENADKVYGWVHENHVNF